MIIGGFVIVVCMIIGKHQKNEKLFDRWRMKEFHKQKIDEATVKNVQIPSGTFWLLIFGRSSRCHSLPPSPRLHLGGGTGFETVALWLCINFPFFLFFTYVWYILLHSTRVHQSKIFRQGSQDPCSSESKTGKCLPPSVTVVPLTFTFTLLCQCKWCCQCCLRALPRSRSTSAGHKHASRGYSRHFQSKFEVLFTERQSQSCIQNQLNMMRNGLDWNLMEIPFHSDSDWRESWSACSAPESSAVDHLLCQNVAHQTFVEHVICGTTCAFVEQVLHVLHIIRPRWNIQHTPDLMGLTAQGGRFGLSARLAVLLGKPDLLSKTLSGN